MLFSAVFIVIIAYTHGSDDRVVGGTPADITEAPYQVALLKKYWYLELYFQSCGGCIISTNFILTAAHCTDRTHPFQWKIRAGSTNKDRGGQVMDVSRIIQHPAYNSRFNNDVSLLSLDKPLTLDIRVAVVSLPFQGQTVVDGANATVTGWGRLSEGGYSPKQLYKAFVPIVNQQQCANIYPLLTNNMICAGTGGIDTCQGDSGGPMTVNGILIGTTSWGIGCARPGNPGVYARVSMYIPWIQTNTL